MYKLDATKISILPLAYFKLITAFFTYSNLPRRCQISSENGCIPHHLHICEIDYLGTWRWRRSATAHSFPLCHVRTEGSNHVQDMGL